MDGAGGVPYTTHVGFGPSGNGLGGLCQPNGDWQVLTC